MPREWTVGEIVTAAEFNLLPRVLFREVLTTTNASVTIEDADIQGNLADWETLRLVVNGPNDGAVIRAVALQFNGDTAANYRWQLKRVDGTGAETHQFDGADDMLFFGRIGAASSARDVTEATIIGHSRNDRTTTVDASGTAATDATAANNETFRGSGWWNALTVVTSITLLTGADNLDVGLLVTLWGDMRREPT